jgi:competence protein ComEC
MNNKNPHKRLFSHHPLFQLSLAYAAGVMTCNFVSPRFAVAIVLCAFSSVGALALFAKGNYKYAGLLLLTCSFFAGSTLALLENRATPANTLKNLIETGCVEDRQTAWITGVLNQPPELSRDGLYLFLELEEIQTATFAGQVRGAVSLSALFKTPTDKERFQDLQLHYGKRIRVKARLNRADQFRNPGVSTFTEYLDRKGFDAAGVINQSTSIVQLDDGPAFNLRAWLYRWRETIQQTIDERFSPETAGVLDAALLGNRHNLSKGAVERFREGGTFHVLVISGLHISFIGGVVLVLARRFTRRRIFQFVISSLVVWGYSVAVGAEASVVRAAMMFTIVAFGAVVFRSASALNALGAAGLIILVNKPSELFDPSLQLTFLSVFAIVTIAWPLLQNFKAIGAWRPTRSSPYPPACSQLVKTLCEALHWSERNWRRELERSPHTYRLFKTPVAPWLERNSLQRLCSYAFNAIVVSVAVQVVLLPLLIIYFHRVSLSSLILNIFVSILIAVLGVIALFAVLVAQLSVTLAIPLIHIANLTGWLMVHSVEPFSSLGLASFRLPEYRGWPAAIYLLYCMPLLLLTIFLLRWKPLGPLQVVRKRSRKTVLTLIVLQLLLGGVVLLHPFSPSRADGKLHVDFLDVGQGDAALVTMPDGTTLLVDGGGRPTFFKTGSDDQFESTDRDIRSIGETVVSEHLWSRGLDKVDYILATHADADHIDGLNDVMRNFSVRSALVARTPEKDSEYSKFAQSLRSTNTHVETIQAGDQLQFGSVIINVLWPYPTNEPGASSGNNDSVVLQLKFGQNSILLTGDIEKQTEAQLLAGNCELKSDVVKVPHHGSRSSSTEDFVKATSPRYAIISVGQRSMFGHPHKEVVERWNSNGAQVLTTGNCGMISVTLDGERVSLSTFVK